MPLLTTKEIREQVQTDLSDAALKKIYDAELKRIEVKVGKNTGVVETKFAGGLVDTFTQRPIGTINSIKARKFQTSDQVTLSSDDYRTFGLRGLRRLTGGTNGASFWGQEVEVNYDPIDDIDRRNLALVELVRIAVEERALASEKDGDYQATYKDPKRARRETLDSLNTGLPIA